MRRIGLSPLLAVVVAAPGASQEARAPARPALGARAVVPVSAPSLPVSPAASAAGALQGLLRLAAGSLLRGGAPAAQVPGAAVPLSLGFAPGRELPAPPALPGSAMQASEGLASKPGPARAQGPAAQPSAAPLRPQLAGGERAEQGAPAREPGMLPVRQEASASAAAVSRRGRSLAEKAAALEAPLKAAAGLATAPGAARSEEGSRGLADGIWDVMTDARVASRGTLGEDGLRDSIAGNGFSNVARESGSLPLAGLDHPDFEKLLDYSGLTADATRASASSLTPSEGALASRATADFAFLAEAVDAAETARRFGPAHESAREQASVQAPARAAKTFAGPVERLWLETVDSLVRLMSLRPAGAQLKPNWSSEAGATGARAAGLRRRGSPEASGWQTGAGAPATGPLSPSDRLVARLARRDAREPTARLEVPAPETVPDGLFALSLLPLLAAALAYAREFR